MWQAAIYTAGFPCTPYSMLGARQQFQDPESQQGWQSLRHIKKLEPAVPWHQT